MQKPIKQEPIECEEVYTAVNFCNDFLADYMLRKCERLSDRSICQR